MIVDIEFAEILREIAADLRVKMVADEPLDDDPDHKLWGSPPSTARIFVTSTGSMIMVSPLATEHDYETALHELAHVKLGLREERQCYEQAAVWALRFPVGVAAAVHMMASEACG